MPTPNRIFYDPDHVFPDWTTEEPIERSRLKVLPFLVVAALLFVLLIVKESYYLYDYSRNTNLANQSGVYYWDRSTQAWMNAREISHFYRVPVGTVFSALNIQASPGDENVTLRELAEKYDKSPAEVRDALNYLNNLQPRRGGKMRVN